jgi:hypothetical protein
MQLSEQVLSSGRILTAVCEVTGSNSAETLTAMRLADILLGSTMKMYGDLTLGHEYLVPY